VTPAGGRPPGVVGGPVVIFRPRVVFLVLGPLLLLGGVAVVASGTVIGVALVIVGLALLAAWRPRIEVGHDVVRARGLVGTTVIRCDDIHEVRLRRVPFGPPRPPHRSYRIGRFSTTPIRLRIVGGEDMIQLTAALWSDWPALVRVVLALPGVQSDSRTRGRLDRYG
jgi:hypothetical protein